MYSLPEGIVCTVTSPNCFLASSVDMEGGIMQRSPAFQSTGVATFMLAVNCSESMARSTSLKFLPVVAGYKMLSLSFLSGPMMKTDLRMRGID